MRRWLAAIVLLLVAAAASVLRAEEASDSAAVRARFADPSREYATAPLWVWNDMLTEEQVRATLRDLAGQKVKQAFVHPRPGLMTPYLSADWFRLWKAALDEAERLDMNVWIYDENSYPSGFAGGLVPAALPDSRGRGLHVAEVRQPGAPGEDLFAVYRLADDSYENVTPQVRGGEKLPDGKYLVATWRLAPQGGWFGGKWYVDLLKPGVTEKFIEITFDAYKRELGEHFGKRLPGIFTDEPHLCPAGGLHWNAHLADEFQKRWGYRLEDHLPALVRPVGDWKKVRHNYYQVLLEQFIEHWAKPCHDWCEANGLEFTGHYWEHGWPGAGHGPDNMAMYAWHQRPAIDCLMNRYDEGVHAQFGNVRAVKELSSVANQMGRTRTLCEAYGAGGWDLRFEDMKRIGDWLYVLGVNTMDEHLSYITIRGARKRDHPQSFSYHEPWWEDYHVMAGYFARLSAAMSAGKEVNRILLLEPTTTAWLYQGERKRLEEIGEGFQKLVTDLSKAQVEFDLGSEDIIARWGSVLKRSKETPEVLAMPLLVGKTEYFALAIPPGTENLNSATVALLEKLFDTNAEAAMSLVYCCGPPPMLVDGQPSDRVARLAKRNRWRQFTRDEWIEALCTLSRAAQRGPNVVRDENDRGTLFHQTRTLDDGYLLLLVNTSIEEPSSGHLVDCPKCVEAWDPATGETSPYTLRDGRNLKFALPPCGSLLLFASEKQPAGQAPAAEKCLNTLFDEPQIRRLGPNVLTLDYVDITTGGKTERGLHFYRAGQMAWKAAGLQGDPWDSCVQFRDELITEKLPPESGFEATYRFTIEGPVPKGLEIVIERPDLYTITCNGRPVTPTKDAWWLDKAFGRIDLSNVAKSGENAVTIKAGPMTMFHELEPAYVLGDFCLKPVDKGFVIVPPEPLAIASRGDAHSTTPDGTMWLTAGVGFGGPQGGNDRRDDTAPFVVFDLGQPCRLGSIKIWNYNEVNLTSRGVKKVRITGSVTGADDSFTVDLGTFDLDQATSGSTAPTESPRFPQTLSVHGEGIRYVRFDILANHAGVSYPTTDSSRDNAFVGLSEVRFFAPDGVPGSVRQSQIGDARIHKVSSELAAGTQFDRRAAYLLDGSGMESAGWNQQGYPFYSQGVGYTETFDVPEPKGTYRVRLPKWYGSVARVIVNGKPAGHIAWQPWECDVTEHIVAGRNTIEVVVVGTLKNTLGPHHAGALRGSAWPSAFRQGPEHGPPPGAKYDTIAYGLFEPFVLVQTHTPDGR